MNEEEYIALSKRAEEQTMLDCSKRDNYIKGASDQDPISRKSEREKIIAEVKNSHITLMNESEIIALIEALP